MLNLKKSSKNIFVLSLVGIFFFLPIFSYADEYQSDSYTLTDAILDIGEEMVSSNFSVVGSLVQTLFGSYSLSNIPLVPGNITSCGKINTPGTYSLSTDINGISGTCFIVSTSSVTINGNGHTVSASNGNTAYAVTATSSISNGGSAQTNIYIQDITFTDFSSGVNANGNNGTTGGAGGSVYVSSSTLGSIVANGGSPGGAGGSISISGTDIDLVGKTLSATGTGGSITVNGTMLVSGSQVWSYSDSSWLGSRSWYFTNNAYNTGTTTGTTTFNDNSYSTGKVVGDAVFMGYTADADHIVYISNNQNFHGTGQVTGNVLDSVGNNIDTWSLSDGSILTGIITGDAIFNDTSYNTGTVSDYTIFNDSSYNAGTVKDIEFTSTSFSSIGGIPDADPTGISNGHTVLGYVTFSATTSPVTFNVSTGSVWNANTYTWVFSTSGQNWVFSSATNTGSIYGDASFNNSRNVGVVYGTTTFNVNSYNSGTVTVGSFYDSTYNIGTVSYASFYNTSMNSHGSTPGTVTTKCDFYDSSLPGIGNCPSNNTYYHIPYYFNNAVSSNWNDIGNWWLDTSFTQHALNIPITGDTVYIGASLTNGPNTSLTLGSIYVASSTTGGGSFSVNLTGASGPVHLYASSTNTGLINGLMHVYGNRGFTQINTSGTYNDSVIFHDNTWNDTTISENVFFYNNSFNSSSGVINGNAEFYGTNANDGSIVGGSVVNIGSTLSGTGTIQGSVSNLGNISGGTFNGVVTNTGASTITGSVSNVAQMIFSDTSYISDTGSLSGSALFNNSSSNRGIVSATSTFYDTSYNIGVTSNAVFVGEYAENDHNSTNGIVLNTKSRLYTNTANQIDLRRDFTGTAWTVIADNTLVKLLYRDKINLFGQDPITLTTTVERNGGIILKPLSTTTPITSCGVLDEASSTYTLGSNISNFIYNTCFFVRADGITLNGGGHSITYASSGTSYAIVATTTLSVDPSPNAYTNLNIKNIIFNDFTYGLWGRGNDVPSGTGGNGASTTIYRTVLGEIDVNGGDPTEEAGDGGDLFIETSTTTHIYADGGSSTACGIGGDGGDVNITTDTHYLSYSNNGGQVSGCSQGQEPRHGSSGSVNTHIVSAATQSASAAAQTNTAKPSSGYNSIFSPSNFVSILLPVTDLLPISLPKLPVFGDGLTSGTFSLGFGINNFLFSFLPDSFTNIFSGPLLSLFKSVGLNKDIDLFHLRSRSLPVADDVDIPGYYRVDLGSVPKKLPGGLFSKSSTTNVPTYIAYDEKNTVTELVKVNPETKIYIHIKPVNDVEDITATFNGKEVNFVSNTLSMTTPFKAGKYVLKSSASPLTLTIEVLATEDNSVAGLDVPDRASVFLKVLNWVKKLFIGLFS